MYLKKRLNIYNELVKKEESNPYLYVNDYKEALI